MTQITKRLDKVFVYPEIEGKFNVIRKAIIFIDFSRNGITSSAAVEAIFNIDNLDSFIDITQLTDAQIIDWAYGHAGGDDLLKMIQPIHEQQIDYLALTTGTVEYIR